MPASNPNYLTSIRFTSIEPFTPHENTIREIADRHGFETEFKSETTVNAPFCGFDYHVQEVCLKHQESNPGESFEKTRELCLDDLMQFQMTRLADGYFEIIG